MSREEQARINNYATDILKLNRSKAEILDTFKLAEIVNTKGEVLSPFDKVFVKK